MDNKEKNQEFTLEDIIREFGSDWLNEEIKKDSEEEPVQMSEEIPAEAPDQAEIPPEEIPAETEAEAETETAEVAEPAPEEAAEETAETEVTEETAEAESLEDTRVIPDVPTDDTVRLDQLELPQMGEEVSLEDTKVIPDVAADDTIRLDDLSQLDGAASVPENADVIEEESEQTEEEEIVLTAAQVTAPEPIKFRSKVGELKRKLVAGPEKRYYDLSEIGLGRVQIAVFLSLLVVALCAGGTALYAMGRVAENRLRLMVFSQILAMMVSAFLGCYVLMDGIMDLFTGKFSLNTMLFLTLAACAADAVFCLQELRVPCCAAFSLEMTFALWNRSMRRSTEMGQMDTLRKAHRLDSVVKVPDHLGNGPSILRGEGRVEDFMDNYNAPTAPEKTLNIYALVSVLACVAIAVLAGMRHGLSLAIQVFSTSMLVAVPAGAFVSQSRPAAILERRLHMVGTVLCGWQGVQSLCGKASFPLHDRDIFPLGAVKLNGVKFLGDREPEDVIAVAAALMRQRGGGLESVFTQLLKSRGGMQYPVEELRVFPGGIGGVVNGESCLLGLSDSLKEQGVEIPDSALVSNAVYFAADGILTAVFALNYSRTKAAAGGLVTLGSYRKIRPMILCRNFMITPQLLKEKFGIKPKRYDFPAPEVRDEFADIYPDPELTAGALTTQQNLSSMAYAVTGARALRNSCRAGLWLNIFAGVLGLLIMAALAWLGDMQLLSPFNILLYQLVWLIPGLLVTEWARTV